MAMNRTRGDMAMGLGDYKKAIEHFKKWKGALLNISGGKTTIEVAESLVVLGEAYEKQGMYPESKTCFGGSVGGSIEGVGRRACNVGGYLRKVRMDVCSGSELRQGLGVSAGKGYGSV